MSSVWSAHQHNRSKDRNTTQQQRWFGSVSSIFIAASAASALIILLLQLASRSDCRGAACSSNRLHGSSVSPWSDPGSTRSSTTRILLPSEDDQDDIHIQAFHNVFSGRAKKKSGSNSDSKTDTKKKSKYRSPGATQIAQKALSMLRTHNKADNKSMPYKRLRTKVLRSLSADENSSKMKKRFAEAIKRLERKDKVTLSKKGVVKAIGSSKSSGTTSSDKKDKKKSGSKKKSKDTDKSKMKKKKRKKKKQKQKMKNNKKKKDKSGNNDASKQQPASNGDDVDADKSKNEDEDEDTDEEMQQTKSEKREEGNEDKTTDEEDEKPDDKPDSDSPSQSSGERDSDTSTNGSISNPSTSSRSSNVDVAFLFGVTVDDDGSEAADTNTSPTALASDIEKGLAILCPQVAEEAFGTATATNRSRLRQRLLRILAVVYNDSQPPEVYEMDAEECPESNNDADSTLTCYNVAARAYLTSDDEDEAVDDDNVQSTFREAMQTSIAEGRLDAILQGINPSIRTFTDEGAGGIGDRNPTADDALTPDRGKEQEKGDEDTATKSSGGSTLSAGAIAGICLGSVFAVGSLVYFVGRKTRGGSKKRKEFPGDGDDPARENVMYVDAAGGPPQDVEYYWDGDDQDNGADQGEAVDAHQDEYYDHDAEYQEEYHEDDAVYRDDADNHPSEDYQQEGTAYEDDTGVHKDAVVEPHQERDESNDHQEIQGEELPTLRSQEDAVHQDAGDEEDWGEGGQEGDQVLDDSCHQGTTSADTSVADEPAAVVKDQPDANFESLERLSSSQVLAIENIGSNQARQGYAYERDELEARLQSIPGLSDDQIDAVIQLELLTRGD